MKYEFTDKINDLEMNENDLLKWLKKIVHESKQREFKTYSKISLKEKIIEISAYLAGFGNASGGLLFFGVPETTTGHFDEQKWRTDEPLSAEEADTQKIRQLLENQLPKSFCDKITIKAVESTIHQGYFRVIIAAPKHPEELIYLDSRNFKENIIGKKRTTNIRERDIQIAGVSPIYIPFKDHYSLVSLSLDEWLKSFRKNLELKFSGLKNYLTFSEWSNRVKENQMEELKHLETFKLRIELFRQRLTSSSHKVRFFRVSGLGRNGKNTLLVEALAKLPNQENIYVIREEGNSVSTIAESLSNYRMNIGTLIVLDCPDKIHTKLVNALHHLERDTTIITLNSDFDLRARRNLQRTEIIDVPPLDQKEAKNLIKIVNPEIPYHLVHHIIQLSGGIPEFIISLISLLKRKQFSNISLGLENQIDGFCETILTSIIEESHFDRPILERVLKGLSLFSHLGWEPSEFKILTKNGEFKPEFEKNKGLFCKLLGLEREQPKLEETVRYLKQIRILSMEGGCIYINLRLLAIYLLNNYFEQGELNKYLEEIQRLNEPYFLERFIERIKDLASEPVGKKIVRNIFRNTYFNSLKDFNDPSKALVFRYLAQIDNLSAVRKLSELFSDVDPSSLEMQLGSLNDIVLGLEHIIWFKDTFQAGMSLLLKLAIADKEQGIASNIFQRTFSQRLPGTSVSLRTRMKYLTGIARSDVPERSFHVLNALSQIFSLKKGHTRVIRAELQAFRNIPPEYNYFPHEESQEYLKAAFELLKKHLYSSKQEIQERAYKILTANLKLFLDLNFWEEILVLWRRYLTLKEENKFHILEAIMNLKMGEGARIRRMKKQLRTYLENPSEEIRDRFIAKIVAELSEELSKNDYSSLDNTEAEKHLDTLLEIKLSRVKTNLDRVENFEQELRASFSIVDEVKAFIRSSYYRSYYMTEFKNYSDYVKTQTAKISARIFRNEKYWEVIKYLITQEGFEVFHIAWELGKLDPSNKKWSGIKKLFLKAKNTRKTAFLSGYFTDLTEKNPNAWKNIVEEIKDEEGLSRELFDLMLKIKLDRWSVDLIIELYESSIINQFDLDRLGHGQRVLSLDPNSYRKLITFCFDKITDPLRIENEYYDPLWLLEPYLKSNEEIIPNIKDLLVKILTSFENNKYSLVRVSQFWSDLIVLLIKKSPETLSVIRQKIFDNLRSLPVKSSDSVIQNLVIFFLEQDPEGTWKEFVRKFKDGSNIHWYFSYYLGYEFLEKISTTWIINLCQEDPDHFPVIFAQLLEGDMRSDQMSAIARLLIENFPDNEELRLELIRAFTSGVRYCLPEESVKIDEMYKKLLEQWKHNDNSPQVISWINEAIEHVKDDIKRSMRWAQKFDLPR